LTRVKERRTAPWHPTVKEGEVKTRREEFEEVYR